MSKEINNLIEDLIEHEAHCPAIYKGGGKGCICVRSKVFYIVSKQRQSIIEIIRKKETTTEVGTFKDGHDCLKKQILYYLKIK